MNAGFQVLGFLVSGAVRNFQEYFYEHSRWFFSFMILANILDVIETISKANNDIRNVCAINRKQFGPGRSLLSDTSASESFR